MRALVKIVAVLVCTALTTAWAEDVLVRAAKVYTMTGPPLAPGEVLISNGKIAGAGAKLTPPAGARIIDLGAGVLMPGLIDAYSHAGIAGSAEEMTREITPEYRVLNAVDWRSRAFREALADGVTTLGLAPGTDGVFAGLSCAVKTAGDRRVLEKETGMVITMASDPIGGNQARQRPDSI